MRVADAPTFVKQTENNRKSRKSECFVFSGFVYENMFYLVIGAAWGLSRHIGSDGHLQAYGVCSSVLSFSTQKEVRAMRAETATRELAARPLIAPMSTEISEESPS